MWAILLSLCLIFPVSIRAVELTIFDPVVSDTSLTLTASLSATSNYYLQGAIRSSSSSKYFGETQNLTNNWIDYISSPEKEYITSNFFYTTIDNATWSGMLNLRFKLDDPNYFGPGSYEVKLRRFTGNSTSPAGESNTLTINLTAATPTPTPSPTIAPTPTPTPSPSPSPVRSPSPTPIPSPTLPAEAISEGESGTVAGEMIAIDLSNFGIATPSASPMPSPLVPTLNQSRAKNVILMGTGLIILSLASFLGVRQYRKQHIISV